MFKCKLECIFRDEGVIKGDSTHPDLSKIMKDKYYLCFGRKIDRYFSFLIQIKDVITVDTKDDTPASVLTLQVDSRKTGPFASGDDIYLMEYSVNTADHVEIAVSEEETLGIPEGDWTSYVKPELLDKVIEIGDELNIPIEFPKDNKTVVKIIQGVISGADIPLPCSIDDTTKCEIKKYSEERIKSIQSEVMKKKQERGKMLVDENFDNVVSVISKIKSEYEEMSEFLKFHGVSGEFMDKTVEGVFSGFSLHDSKINNSEDSFSSSRLYLSKTKDEVDGLIEYHILSKDGKGSIILNVYKKDLDDSIDLSNRLTGNLTKIHDALQKLDDKIEVCPECKLKLPMEHISEDNTVVCQSCGLLVDLKPEKKKLKKIWDF